MILAKMLSKCKKIVYNLTLIGVRCKRIVTLTIFTDSCESVFQLLNQLFFAKLCLLFGLLVYSFTYAKIWQASSVSCSRNFLILKCASLSALIYI